MSIACWGKDVCGMSIGPVGISSYGMSGRSVSFGNAASSSSLGVETALARTIKNATNGGVREAIMAKRTLHQLAKLGTKGHGFGVDAVDALGKGMKLRNK